MSWVSVRQIDIQSRRSVEVTEWCGQCRSAGRTGWAGVATEEGYLLDNQQAAAGQRFDALAELFDPVTLRHLRAIGVARTAVGPRPHRRRVPAPAAGAA
jgi:hypothetical protein